MSKLGKQLIKGVNEGIGIARAMNEKPEMTMIEKIVRAADHTVQVKVDPRSLELSVLTSQTRRTLAKSKPTLAQRVHDAWQVLLGHKQVEE